MNCSLCNREFQFNEKYISHQNMMKIPVGEPTCLEHHIIDGTICLDCYYMNYSSMFFKKSIPLEPAADEVRS